mmetsp:Transcript_3411/g.3981  ORF Transcript_3411/g.3981 Transcript_3411/m.3981 type:complete len:217 (-) Transcript_3411:248-898(-)
MVQAAYLIILFHFFSNSFGCCQGFIIPPKSNILHQQSLDKTQHLLISHSASYQNQCPFPHQTQHRPTLKLQLIPFPDLEITEATTTFISEASGESWRQYVPLIVISGVLLDIVLGSPLANLALSPMRRATLGDENDDADSTSENANPLNKKKFVSNSNERVDTAAIAEAAVQRARYSMELRIFLEENKTDEQRYEEIRKKMDQQAAEFDKKTGYGS